MKQVYAAITSLKHCFSWILLILAVFVTSCRDFSSHLARVVCQAENSLLRSMGWSVLHSPAFAAGGRG